MVFGIPDFILRPIVIGLFTLYLTAIVAYTVVCLLRMMGTILKIYVGNNNNRNRRGRGRGRQASLQTQLLQQAAFPLIVLFSTVITYLPQIVMNYVATFLVGGILIFGAIGLFIVIVAL